MVSQISLGNFYQQNGRTVVGGSQSGFDTEALINALATAKRQPAVQLEDKIKLNDTRSTALNSLQSILTRFKDAANFLRNPPGVSNSTSNVFAYRSTTLTTNSGVAGDTYVSVTAQPGAQSQNLSISDIERLARETKQDSNVFTLPNAQSAAVVAGGAPGMFGAGTFTLRNVKAGEPGVAITLNDGDSLQTVANKFNAMKENTGIQATVLKVADGNPDSTFKIVFTATKTGTTYGFDLADAATVTGDPDGVLANMSFNTSQTAQNARFTIDNVVVEREQNTVSDLIDGLSFTLKRATPEDGTAINVAVVPDESLVKNAITQFVDAYNEFRIFASKQIEVGDDGMLVEGAVLSANQAMRSVISRVGSEIATVVAGITGGNPSRLADIGLDFGDYSGDDETPFTRNVLQINEEKLTAALSSNFEGVMGLFQFQMTSDNPSLTIFKRTNGLNVSNFTLNIDRTNEVYTASYVDAYGVTQTTNLKAAAISGGSGITLAGDPNSPLAGLELIFASADTTATINVNVSQGVGDRLFNALDEMLKSDGGVVTQEIETLKDANSRYKTEITRIDEQISRYREQLQAQYAALEAALSQANRLLQMLDAQQQAQQQG